MKVLLIFIFYLIILLAFSNYGPVSKLLTQVQTDIEVIVFVPLNVTRFIDKNSNQSALKKALIERDQYYKNVCESAYQTIQENILLNKKYSELIELNKSLKMDNKIKTEELNIAHGDFKTLTLQLKRMQDILKKSVYPEIANELLRDMGLLKGGDDIINAATCPVIKDNDSVIDYIKNNEKKYSDNNVIQGLFNKL